MKYYPACKWLIHSLDSRKCQTHKLKAILFHLTQTINVIFSNITKITQHTFSVYENKG